VEAFWGPVVLVARTIFFGAAFFCLGLVAVAAVFRAVPALPSALLGVGSAPLASALAVSIFDFLGTFCSLRVECQIYRRGGCCKRILANRLREERNCAYHAAMRHFVFRWMITTVAVMIAPAFIRGIRYDTVGSLIGAALLLGILNAFVRPVLLILSAPLILVTLGFFILVVNALLLLFVPNMVIGFHVDTFGSAFWGALLISIISWVLSAFFRGSDGHVHVLTHHTQVKSVEGRVIEPTPEGPK
jgi:putative membrane protein